MQYFLTINATLQADNEDDAVDRAYEALEQCAIFEMFGFEAVEERD
jgi:hypothetical protein